MSLLDDLLQQPWTWIGPTPIDEAEGRHIELRIAELPDFRVLGDSIAEVDREKRDALRAFLDSYVREGEIPPLPTRIWVLKIAKHVAFPRNPPLEPKEELGVTDDRPLDQATPTRLFSNFQPEEAPWGSGNPAVAP